jgi:hypothetical protein
VDNIQISAILRPQDKLLTQGCFYWVTGLLTPTHWMYIFVVVVHPVAVPVGPAVEVHSYLVISHVVNGCDANQLRHSLVDALETHSPFEAARGALFECPNGSRHGFSFFQVLGPRERFRIWVI